MPSQDEIYATIAHQNTTVGNTNWYGLTVGPEYPALDYMWYAVLNSGETTYYLITDHFGFTIPTGSTIDGLVVLPTYSVYQGDIMSNSLRMVKGGTIQSTELTSGSWNWGNGYEVAGGETNLLGSTWTAEDINSDNFGVAISGSYIDYGVESQVVITGVAVWVYYTEGVGGGGGNGIYANNSYFTFRSVAIPKRVVVNKAFVRFTAKDSSGMGAHDGNGNDIVKVMISGQAADSGSTPTDANEAYDLAKTTSCMNWDTVPTWTANTTYDTPDIACVVQEIVDRSGWNSGNNITIFVEDYDSGNTGSSGTDQTRLSYDYTDDSSKAAQLFVYYSLEEFGSGGVNCAGSAINSRTLSPTISAAGALAAGSAVVSKKVAITISAAGALAAGSATSSYVPGTSTYNEIGSGGAYVASSAIIYKINNFSITAAGIYIAGSLLIGPNRYSQTMSGGVYINSGAGLSLPDLSCSSRGTGTAIGKMVSTRIANTTDDGNFSAVSTRFTDSFVEFGFNLPVV